MPASKEELGAAMRRLYDALAFMRGPDGEVIYVGEKAMHMAWHLARTGADVHPERAVIKRRGVRPQAGILAGTVDWVPVDWPDADRPEPVTAVGPVPDPATFDDALPWHTKTKIEGGFA